MKMPAWIVSPLRARLQRIINSRPPDFVVGQPEDPYLLRWWVLGETTNKEGRRISKRILGCRIYLHIFKRSDDDRALHDHPAGSLSVGCGGSGVEHTIAAGGVNHRRTLGAGDVRLRSAKFAHRIEIEPGTTYMTLFIFGPDIREWGFHCPNGWIPWHRFVADDNGGAIGRGCGEMAANDNAPSQAGMDQDGRSGGVAVELEALNDRSNGAGERREGAA